MESKTVNLASDDEKEEECMPRIINTVSLQGCSALSFEEEQENELDTVLYPECEINEENEAVGNLKTDPVENGLSVGSKDKDEKNIQENKAEKKRLKLTQLSPVSKKKPSTSGRNDRNVVDAGGLSLLESLFKTKELFDTFLRVCQDQENSEQMERVVEKLTRAYDATRQEFLGSPAFQNILEAETEKVNTSDTKPWLNLKLVLDELKHNKKSVGPKLKLGESEESQDAGGTDEDEPIIECPKKRRHLKKLEKVLRAINLKIKKLEEREVDWDEEDNSAYCKLDRYRSQFTKIYSKICEIKGKLPDADRPYLRKVSFAGTTYPHINRCIEKYYNKHRDFPDFQDIKKLVTLAVKQEGIEMPPIKIHSIAAAAFKEFGEMLKRLRQYDDYDVLVSYLEQQVDPARDNEELQELLNKNALLFKKKEQEVIDKFAEQDAGICSESAQDSDKPKRKKKRIMIENPSTKKKPSSPVKPHLSSDESSDEEDEHPKVKSSLGLNSNSDSDISGSGSESKVKKQSVKGKGKTLIGKPRIVKKGVKKNSPKKTQKPKVAISSDEESAPKNTKESLTNYLGLQGRNSPKTNESKESKHISDSEDEITCMNEVQRPALGARGKTVSALSDSSSSEKATKTKAKARTEDVKSDSSCSSRGDLKGNEDCQIKINTIADSDSDVEPIAVVTVPKPVVNTRKPVNQARKRTGPLSRKVVTAKHTTNTSKTNIHETISASSDSDSDSRTNGSESDSKKRPSRVESRTGTKRLSSDHVVGKKKDEKGGNDDAIIILSEDVIEDPKPAAQKQTLTKARVDSSDSDGSICILSTIEPERRTVAPRKTKFNNSSVLQSSSPRRTGPATSTPQKTFKPQLKRSLPSQPNNGNKSRKLETRPNINGNQTTLPQFINGASRKVIISRVAKSASSSSTTTPEPIPLIELD